MHLPEGVTRYCLLLLLLALTALARCWNHTDVFVGGRTFFADGDCYSRMTRVRQIVEHPLTVIHRHNFENWPDGTLPHTTAPFDYLTAAVAAVLRLFMPDTQSAIDRAGALISPLLGVLTAAFLWGWAGRLGLAYRVPMIILFATSPILVHGTVLGRPDHQSLLILCMAVAIGAEAALLIKPSRSWSVIGGLGWGLGLWVSLYEPAVLLLGAILLRFGLRVVDRARRQPAICDPNWQFRWGFCALVLLLALVIEGWHTPVPDPEIVKFFPNWSRMIGELGHASLAVLFRWTCAVLPLSPILLLLSALNLSVDSQDVTGRMDRAAWFWLTLLVLTFLLTCWELRWGYFFALVFVMGLPWQLAVLARRKRWLAPAVFVASLLPVAVEWHGQLLPVERERARRAEQRGDNMALYDVAEQLRGPHSLPVLAPWWQSPALAYWSGQPCVAGSSHESLPGTVDSARFYMCEDPIGAFAILDRRKVACVLAYEPTRVLATSSILLGIDPMKNPNADAGLEEHSDRAMGSLLFRQPHRPPAFLELVYSNAAFRVFLRRAGVDPDGTPGIPTLHER